MIQAVREGPGVFGFERQDACALLVETRAETRDLRPKKGLGLCRAPRSIGGILAPDQGEVFPEHIGGGIGVARAESKGHQRGPIATR